LFLLLARARYQNSGLLLPANFALLLFRLPTLLASIAVPMIDDAIFVV